MKLLTLDPTTREPNPGLIDLLERALDKARKGELIAGAGCLVGDDDQADTHWNVVATYDQAYKITGMLTTEIHDIVARAQNKRVMDD